MVSEGVPAIDGGVPIPVEDFAYDGEGNRISSHLSSLYLSDDHNRLTEDSDYTYSYDDRGNRVSRTAKVGGVVETYGYDSQNRLVSYDSGSGTIAAYAYDALERRIAKTVGGVTTAYVYDASANMGLATDDILLEFDTSGPAILTRRWLHSDAVDEPVAFETYVNSSGAGSGVAREVYADRQGSVIFVVDPASASVDAAYEYDSFGALTQVAGALQQPYGYTGREFDVESGLYYYRARTYDPATGMFLQSDPIGFEGGSLGLYTYVSNDPFGWGDPSGLSPDSMVLSMANRSTAITATSLVFVGLIYALEDILNSLGQIGNLVGSTSYDPNSLPTTTPPPPGNCSPEMHKKWQDRIRAC